jgi:hypothetical protein
MEMFHQMGVLPQHSTATENTFSSSICPFASLFPIPIPDPSSSSSSMPQSSQHHSPVSQSSAAAAAAIHFGGGLLLPLEKFNRLFYAEGRESRVMGRLKGSERLGQKGRPITFLAIYRRGGEGGEGGWLEGRKDDNWSRVLANGQQNGAKRLLGLLRREEGKED